jgi:hypothetical protein
MFRINAQQCAKAIADGVARNARTVVTPRAGWGLVILQRLFPSFIDGKLEDMYFRGLSS